MGVRRRAAILLLGLLVPAAVADDEPRTIGDMADALVAAHDAERRDDLQRLAVLQGPDRWLVADELVHQGRGDVLRAFAALVPEPAGAPLRAYAEVRAKAAADVEARTAVATAFAALRAGEWQAALEATAAIEGPYDNATRIEALYGRAHALRKLKRLAESAATFDAVAEAAEALGWSGKTGLALRHAARSTSMDGDWEGSLDRNRRAGAAYARAGDEVACGETILHMGLACESLGRLDDALEHYARAAAHFEAVRHGPGYVDALYSAAGVHSALGRYREARDEFGRGLELARQMDHKRLISRGLTNRGAAQVYLGRYREALADLRASLPLTRELGHDRGMAVNLDNIGGIHVLLGEYAEAFTVFREARAAAERADHGKLVAAILENQGLLHMRLGQPEEALVLYRRALDLDEREGRGARTAGVLVSLGNASRRLGSLDEAETYYEKAHERADALGDPAARATALASLADVRADQGRGPEALTLARKAEAILASLDDPRRHARALTALGVLLDDLGRDDEALGAYTRALDRLEGVPEPDTRARALAGRADVLLGRGETAPALTEAREAVELVASLAAGLADVEAAGARDLFAWLFDVGMRAAARGDDEEALAWFFEQGRAGSLREGLEARGALATAIVPADLREELAVAHTAERRALDAQRAAVRDGNLRAGREARRALQDARLTVQRATARVQREAKRAAAIVYPEPDDLATIRGRLAPEEALVLYGLTGEEAVALVVRREDARIVRLGATEPIQGAIDAVLRDDEPFIVPAAVGALRALVAAPLALGEDVERVLVSPMGRLGFVPFALLLPEHVVAYVPSGTTHGLLAEERELRGTGVLALGDPDYGPVAPAAARIHRGLRAGRLAPLPATRAEVEAIGTTVLLGDRATESGLREALATEEHWRAVHLACHGLVDDEHPLLSSLAVTADEANDGFLTCLEIFRLPVPADLVVLSACETGKGGIYQTEGILGLTRAFMFAGSPRVLASLWKVDDEATQALMVRFYELWRGSDETEGVPAAEALRKAQAHVRSQDKWRHPQYWAAWVLWGLPD